MDLVDLKSIISNQSLIDLESRLPDHPQCPKARRPLGQHTAAGAWLAIAMIALLVLARAQRTIAPDDVRTAGPRHPAQPTAPPLADARGTRPPLSPVVSI